ncbi:Putative Type IIC bifunctional restriction-modification protein with endonuclease and N6-adenine DNA methyltransferase activity [Synechococcus sp. BMK-MC-1]|nr:Putative Type IIC bifunctional restriction-modification protein with endonuclease and N6-adenine DNA methyltransferase activity [Synechococcus sp. BMK-MC-1]
MNTAALKTFAPAMRRQLIEAVGRKLDLLLNSQTPDTLSTYTKQIAELRSEQEKSREQLLERVAYTWFNRLCALRYLDAKGWHPFGCKVLMPAGEGETQPELLKLMRSGSLPSDLQAFTNEPRLNQLLDGQIPTAIPGGDSQGEVYRELVLAACRSYHQLLPDLFEGLDDASELLLPDDLLTEGSIAGSFRSSISDFDCEDVEIIGWLYQFYISEKKDAVIGKVVKSEDIPAATQLFTPNWIVKYMVQNTIGAQWLATYPDSPLREQMEFYIEPAEQTDEVKAKLAEITPTSLNPEELTLMDPACGSGHILVEAYEIFKAIYLEQGYQPREIPKLILEKNLFGLDIDERAAQLTTFALMTKGRGDDKRLLDRDIKLNIMALQNSTNFNPEEIAQHVNLSDYGLQLNVLTKLKKLFEHAKTFGSLIQLPDALMEKIPALKQLQKTARQELLASEALKRLGALVQQAELLATQYDSVVENPPYMGGGGMNAPLKTFAQNNFPDAKSDLFACFIERGYTMAKAGGHNAMVTMQSWMFLSSFQTMRERMLREKTITTMAQIGYNSFPSLNSKVAQATVFSLVNHRRENFVSTFVDLNSAAQSAPKDEVFLKRDPANRFSVSTSEFVKVPGSPVAYWVSEKVRSVFDRATQVGEVAEVRQGLATGDNNRFLRAWHELSHGRIGFGYTSVAEAETSSQKWFPYNKGGDFRKWYGNQYFVVNWENDGKEIRVFGTEVGGRPRSRAQSTQFYFRPSLSWSKITSSGFALRRFPAGFIFDVAGCSIFGEKLTPILGCMNSAIMTQAVNSLSPTLNFEVGQVQDFPLIEPTTERLLELIEALVAIARSDWNAFELTWDFQSLPLLQYASDSTPTLESSYTAWISQNKGTIAEMKRLEEENNRLFIDVYGLADELTPDVPIEQITLTVNPAYRYGGDSTEEEKWKRFQRDSMAELLSYATGCMMGRYSLDQPGLILADSRSNQDEQLAAYEAKVGKPISEIQFKPDADAIIPVLDGEWFEDDIVARTREFLKVTFPESSVAENLRFIEDSIGKDIRKYFCKDFYKDHLQTYKKRPIYWMVQSPAGPSRGGFACLIYLHRYTPVTLLQVLNNYFRPYLQKLEARQEQLERDQNNDALPKREQTAARKEAEKITKVLKECQAWEQDALLPLAQQRIELDLDDGVKVNYLKLQEVLAKIPGLAAKGD